MVTFEQHTPDDSILDRLRQSARARVEREQAEAENAKNHLEFLRFLVQMKIVTDFPDREG